MAPLCLDAMVRKSKPMRPHDAQCGQVIRDGDDAPEVVRKMKGSTRKTVAREEQCECDAHHTLRIADDLGVAVCSTHHPDKVSGY
jgi:hypothetical protein